MKKTMTNRQTVQATMWALAIAFSGTLHAASDPYPVKPIRMLVGFSPGGSTDIVARVIGQKLSERLGQPVVVENRAGADGTIAIERTVAAAPDGYTLITLAGSQLVQAALRRHPAYDVQRDLTPIAQVTTGPVVLVVNPSLGLDSVDKLIAHARSQPGKLSYGSDGVAGVQHLAAELFKLMAKVNLVHVPYKGGSEAAIAVAGGQIQVGFPSITSALPFLTSGKLRALAVSSMKRPASLPSVPTLNEAGLTGYDFSSWQGVAGPARLPKTIVAKLNAAIVSALNVAEVKDAFSRQGREVDTGTPEQFGAFMRNELDRNRKLIEFVGLKRE